MQFKSYDEVDPEQANEIMLISHGEPADSKSVARIRRLDPFCSPWFRMFALEGGKVVAQVGATYPWVETTQGKMKAGFVEAVAGMPSQARKGYATALMKKVHERMIDDSVELFVLGTSKTLVAYSMYPKLGYHDMKDFNWGLKKGGKYPDTGITAKVRRHKTDDGDRMFRKLAKNCMGFVHRPSDYPRLRCSWGDIYNKAVSFSRDEEPIGYALVQDMGHFLRVREMVCPDLRDYGPCLRTLENRFKKSYITRSITGRNIIADQFSAHGFKTMENWGLFMAMDARGKMSAKEVTSLLGIDRDKFQMFMIDTY